MCALTRRLVDDESEKGCYCTNAELKTLITFVEAPVAL